MSTEEVAKKILRHLRRNQGTVVAWKELANVTKARPEAVKDAVAALTREAYPITVAGAGCTYANSKVRRKAAKEEEVPVAPKQPPAQPAQPAHLNPKNLLTELATMRERLLAEAGHVETMLEMAKRGELSLPTQRNAAAEGQALKALRLERGATVAAMAGWLGKSTDALEALERGEAFLSDGETVAAAQELRMDPSVLAKRLRDGREVTNP